MNKVRVRTADQPLRRLLFPAAALSLGAAFVVGATGVSAQDDIDGTCKDKMADVTSGLPLPPGFKLPF